MNSRRTAGRRKGKPETRAALVEAVRRRFVADGYGAVTVRQIAADAGVDPALINYFFGGKRELFAAAMALAVNPADVVAGLLDGPLDGLAERLLRGLVTTWDDPGSGSPLVSLVRATTGDEQLAELLRGFATQELIGPISRALGEDSPLRGAAVATQLLGLVYARYVLGLEPHASADPDTLVALHAPALDRLIRPA